MLGGCECSRDRKYHLYFRRKPKPKGKKTNIYIVEKDHEYGLRLGEVRWHGAFRQYCFYPEKDSMFSKGCLELINNFLDKKNKRHRNKLRKKKK